MVIVPVVPVFRYGTLLGAVPQFVVVLVHSSSLFQKLYGRYILGDSQKTGTLPRPENQKPGGNRKKLSG